LTVGSGNIDPSADNIVSWRETGPAFHILARRRIILDPVSLQWYYIGDLWLTGRVYNIKSQQWIKPTPNKDLEFGKRSKEDLWYEDRPHTSRDRQRYCPRRHLSLEPYISHTTLCRLHFLRKALNIKCGSTWPQIIPIEVKRDEVLNALVHLLYNPLYTRTIAPIFINLKFRCECPSELDFVNNFYEMPETTLREIQLEDFGEIYLTSLHEHTAMRWDRKKKRYNPATPKDLQDVQCQAPRMRVTPIDNQRALIQSTDDYKDINLIPLNLDKENTPLHPQLDPKEEPVLRKERGCGDSSSR